MGNEEIQMNDFKKQVLARLDALELAIMNKNSTDSSKLRVRKVDETTPMNTVIIVNKKRYFFYKLRELPKSKDLGFLP